MKWEKHSVLVVVRHHAGTRIIIFGQWPHLAQTWRVSDMEDKTNKPLPAHLKSYFSKTFDACFKKKNDLPSHSDSTEFLLLFVSSPLLLSWIQCHTPSLLSTVTASFHSSSVSHVSPCAFMLCWTKARHLPDCVCVCLSACLGACVVPVCGVETKKRWQRAMVLTQKWVLQLVCVCTPELVSRVRHHAMMVTVEEQLEGAALRSVLMPLSLCGLVPFS